MKTYELTYIISPEITLEEAGAKAKEIEALVQKEGGSVLKQLNPSAKVLSYPVKKHASGFLGVLEFQLEPEKLLEVKNALSKDVKISRHMITIKKPANLKKSATRRSLRIKPAPVFEIEKKPEIKERKPSSAKATEGKEKVELKDIEQTLDEILG